MKFAGAFPFIKASDITQSQHFCSKTLWACLLKNHLVEKYL